MSFYCGFDIVVHCRSICRRRIKSTVIIIIILQPYLDKLPTDCNEIVNLTAENVPTKKSETFNGTFVCLSSSIG